MKLVKLTAKNYRSLRDVSVEFSSLNVFIGANASGKSTILDALRFLQEGVQTRDFNIPVYSRGGFLNLAWKGEPASTIELTVEFEDGDARFEWSVRLNRTNFDFSVTERVSGLPLNSPPQSLLSSESGEGWWWSGEQSKSVILKQEPTICALAAASADASFPAVTLRRSSLSGVFLIQTLSFCAEIGWAWQGSPSRPSWEKPCERFARSGSIIS